MTKSRYCLWGFLIILLYFLPNIIWGENSVLPIHDFLDSNVAHIHAMVESGTVWDFDASLPILSGVPRASAGSPLNLRVLLYCLLPPFWAIIAGLFLIKLSAFLGMFFLLTGHVLKGRGMGVAFLASILFAFVPFYPDYGISSAGIPMLALAFLSLWEGRYKVESFVLIGYFAFFSSLVLSGFFACVVLAVLLAVSWARSKKFPMLPFVGLCFLSALYIGLNFDLFLGFWGGSGEVSHRVEFAAEPLLASLGTSLSAFLVSQYHAGTCLAAIPVAVFLLFVKRFREYRTLRFVTLLLLSLMLLGVVLREVFLRTGFGGGFQPDRFYFLYPALVFTLLAVVLQEMPACRKWMPALMLVVNLGMDVHFRDNLATRLGITDYPSFSQYFDTALFDRIKADTGWAEGRDKCASLAMHPAVAEYNGMYTVDGYYPSYPLRYKHEFQRVIQGELDKSASLESYFCGWGSRCYVFSSELGTKYLWGKNSGQKVDSLSIDTRALKELGCTWLFSAVPVENAALLGLSLEGVWEGENSFWRVYGYRL